MWKPYIHSTRQHLDEAARKIVFDKFHIAKHLHDALDQVRKAEHRLSNAGLEAVDATIQWEKKTA